MVNLPVLILNQNYEPLNVCRARRALVLVYKGKAEMIENGSGLVHSANNSLPLPSVIRLFYMIKRPRPERRVTRLEIFSRDKYACQYCGRESQQLTLDHVIPRHLGGQHTWENIVSACGQCNRHKAGRTPEQASMKLTELPTFPPSNNFYFIPAQHQQTQSKWQKYLPRRGNISS